MPQRWALLRRHHRAFGHWSVKKSMLVALASDTARVVKLSATDRSLSLMGPLGGIHNLDVVMPIDASSGDDLFPAL